MSGILIEKTLKLEAAGFVPKLLIFPLFFEKEGEALVFINRDGRIFVQYAEWKEYRNRVVSVFSSLLISSDNLLLMTQFFSV